MSTWYKAGTVTITNGSANVVGVDTLWASQVSVGDVFTIDGTKLYEIASITDNTHLVLQAAYTGTTAGNSSYGIIRNFTGTTQAELAADLAALLNSWQTREDQYRNWQAGTSTGGTAGDGAYPITDILGNTYNYFSPAKLDKLASGLFGHKTTTTTGLTLGYFGGVLLVDGVITTIADGTVALTASATNYIEATRAGVVSKNTTGFTAGSIPIREVVTGTAAIASIAERLPRDMLVTGRLSKSVAGNTDITLTAAEARNQIMEFTGALTGNISVIVPTIAGIFVIGNSTSGSYTLTVKTPAGTGVTVGQGERALLFCDGTNVVNAFTSALGINAADVANTPAGNIAATTVQAAINELDSEKGAVAGNLSQFAAGGAIAPASVNGVTTDSTTNKPVTAASINGGTLPASVTTLSASGDVTVGDMTVSTRNKPWTTVVGNGAAPTPSGSENTAIGSLALSAITTGSDNTALGMQAGNATTTGANNLLLGYLANTSSPGASNETVIGNSSTVTAKIYGNATVTGNISATTTGKVGTTLGVGNATPAASGAGVTFPATQSASTDPNTLDDYERGTWTPTQGAGLTVVGAFSSGGNYTKKGNEVTVWGYIAGATSVEVTSSGLAFCGGAPFTPNANSTCGALGINNGTTASITLQPTASTTTIYAAGTMSATVRINFSATYFV